MILAYDIDRVLGRGATTCIPERGQYFTQASMWMGFECNDDIMQDQ